MMINNTRLIAVLNDHGVTAIEQDGEVLAVSVSVDCLSLAVHSEWVSVDARSIREFLGY